VSRARVTRDCWRLEVNYGYGHGWEVECVELTPSEGKKRLKEYRENCQYSSRLTRGRERVVTRA
jgi:hypothetical protein